VRASEQPRIIVGRWQVTYHVPEGHPSAGDLCQHLNASIETDVSQACAALLNQPTTQNDPAIYLIRRLDLAVNVSLSERTVERSAKHLGEQLAAIIQKTISSEESDSMIRFPDRAAYLARFALDLAAGRAWGKWYFQEFDPLRQLSASRAICEALSGDPSQTGPALKHLMHLHGLHQVLESLTPRDSETLFRAWQANAGAAKPSAACIGRMLAYAGELPFRSSQPGDHNFRDGLWWATLAAAAQSPEPEDDAARLASIQALLDVRRVLANLSFGERADALDRLARGDVEGANGLAPRHGFTDALSSLQLFADHIHGDLHRAQQAEGALFGEQDYLRHAKKSRPIPRGPANPSLHAGIFRLGPSFVESGCEAILAGSASAALFRHLVAMKCLGAARAASSGHDPAVQIFSGLEEDWEAALAELPEHAIAGLSERIFADNLTRDRQGPPWLVEFVTLPHSASQAVLMRDASSAAWLDAAIAETQQEAEAWAARYTASGCLLRFRNSEPVPEQTLRPVDPHLRYYSLAGLSLPPDLDLALTILAHRTISRFQRGLIGLEHSSPQHLYENILAGTGFLRDTGESFEVELPAPALSVVLRLCGVLEHTFALPWIGEKSICIRPLTD
jgi:hypothetical protein